MVGNQSRLSETFLQARAGGEAALIPYITGGYPDVETNVALICQLFRCGASMVEIGIPFSDPPADGVTIQRAGAKALAAGVTTFTCLDIARRVSGSGYGPLILMGYYNTVLNYGQARFAADCREAGVAGLIVPDLPPEEAEELRRACRKNNVDVIHMVAPTSTDDRLALAAESSSGFLYCVSVAGVTGLRSSSPAGLQEFVNRVRHHTNLPLAVGFGISTPDQARSVAAVADGVIVGSALIDTIDRSEGANTLTAVGEYIADMKKACRYGHTCL